MAIRHHLVPAALTVAACTMMALTLTGGVAGAAPVGPSGPTRLAAPLTNTPISSPYRQFVNKNSGKCLSIPNSSHTSGVQIHQFSCLNQTNFGWLAVLDEAGDGYFFRNENENSPNEKCMAVKDGSEARGAAIVQEPCNYANTPARQKFIVIETQPGWGIFQNLKSLLCLRISGASTQNNANLIQEPCADPNSTAEWFQLRSMSGF